jgi:hypothetical protein
MHSALQAVFADPDGTVLYGSCCSIGILTADNTLVLPPDGDGLANFAVQELADHTLEVRTNVGVAVSKCVYVCLCRCMQTSTCMVTT